MTYRIPAQISQVVPGEGADKAGIEVGDRILAVDGKHTPEVIGMMETLGGYPGRTVDITIVRNDNDTLILPVAMSQDAKMGVGLEINPAAFYKTVTKKYGVLESIPRGIQKGTDQLTTYASSLKLLFTKEGAKSIGGFGAIGSIFPETWNWIAFWNIAAFLSVALAVMNILPIPALDGGHVLFLLYEVITHRKPSQKFMEWAQMIGMGLLIILLLYANGMDIVRMFR